MDRIEDTVSRTIEMRSWMIGVVFQLLFPTHSYDVISQKEMKYAVSN